VRNTLSVLNVYKKRTLKSEIVTQLLYGDTFKILKRFGSWIKIRNDSDGYKGYIKSKNFPNNEKNTHKVKVLCSSLYLKPNNKKKINKKLSFASNIKIIEKYNNFYKFDNFWIKKKDLTKIENKTEDIFKNINKFIGVKYKWGGKHFAGVDCSGLIQLFFNFNNKFCPRDAKDQIKFFNKKVKLEKIKKNDLIFWKGHVAVAISRTKIIHAYGPLKKVVVMSLKKTVARIQKTAKLKVIGIRRIT
tara:strand:- start:1552 stop:2286 length:735 start_codon:yes stop_codon:yes gene_type:complete